MDDLIDKLVTRITADLQPDCGAIGEWKTRALQLHAPELLPGDRAAELLDWAREHPRWRLTVAECASEVCAKPREAGIYVAVAIVEELLEEAGLL
ncbi:MAG: hypothetical protein KJO07_25410 [Deltaproteobacteria bacterium]|nr:hypothetical protein [Deltaproteobacteria bacterium]